MAEKKSKKKPWPTREVVDEAASKPRYLVLENRLSDVFVGTPTTTQSVREHETYDSALAHWRKSKTQVCQIAKCWNVKKSITTYRHNGYIWSIVSQKYITTQKSEFLATKSSLKRR